MAKKSAGHVAANAPFDFEAQDISISKLLLDPNNYRFLDGKKFKKKAANRFHEESVQNATLEKLEQHYELDELKHSIITNGTCRWSAYRHSLPQEIGLFLGSGGNRRVAALKSLLKEKEEGVRELTQAQLASFAKIPCAILKSAGTSLKHAERIIMGIRHIAGPREWVLTSSNSSVSELKDEEDLEFKEIGEALGISSVEASRRYRAIGALKQMEQDDLFLKKAEPAFYKLFHELVALPEVRTRFGWSWEESAFDDMEKARQFFELIAATRRTTQRSKRIATCASSRVLSDIPKQRTPCLTQTNP